jgi:hypothetical protein
VTACQATPREAAQRDVPATAPRLMELDTDILPFSRSSPRAILSTAIAYSPIIAQH